MHLQYHTIKNVMKFVVEFYFASKKFRLFMKFTIKIPKFLKFKSYHFFEITRVSDVWVPEKLLGT
jgi:hypothetical protein